MRQSLYKTNDQRQKITEAKSSNLTFVYIDDILSINDPHFTNWIPLIYPQTIEIKETTETASFSSFLDIYLTFDTNGELSYCDYDKRNFNFAIVNFPRLDSNIPTAPANGVNAIFLKIIHTYLIFMTLKLSYA
jgi:uncharacterized protein with PQ loop repeat